MIEQYCENPMEAALYYINQKKMKEANIIVSNFNKTINEKFSELPDATLEEFL